MELERHPMDLPRIVTVWLCLLLVTEFTPFSALVAFSRLWLEGQGRKEGLLD